MQTMHRTALALAAALALGFPVVPTGAAEVHEPGREKIKEIVLQVITESLGLIVMTEKSCEALGDGWTLYKELGGRFPLGAGTGVDDREEEAKFELGEKAGEYRHKLTAPEMPRHSHDYKDKHLDNRKSEKANRGDDDDKERLYGNEDRKTKSKGGNMPHNNMPPYLVLNFCHRSKE